MADPNNQSGTESANSTCSINIDKNVDLRKSNEVQNDNKKDYSSMSDAQNMEDIKTRKKKLVEDLSKFDLRHGEQKSSDIHKLFKSLKSTACIKKLHQAEEKEHKQSLKRGEYSRLQVLILKEEKTAKQDIQAKAKLEYNRIIALNSFQPQKSSHHFISSIYSNFSQGHCFLITSERSS